MSAPSAVATRETGLFLEGLRCAGCARRVEQVLAETAGVAEASVDFASLRAWVRHDADVASESALVERVESLGYTAAPYDPQSLERPAEREGRRALARLLVAAFLAGNVMVVAGALYLGEIEGMQADTRRALRWLCVVLSLPAATFCAWPFWRGALAGLRRFEVTMDLPVVLGISAALVANVLGTWAERQSVFADSAAMIVFLVLLGRTLERRARSRAAGAVERLLALAPRRAERWGAAGWEDVDVAVLVSGDRVRVAPGGAIPADARVLEGESEIDASLLTGESLPVVCRPGDAVAAGARNLLTELTLEVSVRPQEGTLARMAALLERAGRERPHIQRTADRVAQGFAPAVLTIAGVAGFAWLHAGAAPLDALLVVASVLIVACPCALGLATPACITSAVGRAARLGVLVKSGEALERCASVDCVLLDKTGTLTAGAFALERVATLPDVEEKALLRLAATAEGASLHPLAQAIRRAAGDGEEWDEPEGTERRTRAGLGVEARVRGERVLVGSRAALDAYDVEVPDALRREADAFAARALSLVWVARGDRAIGVLGLTDPPRADAGRALARLARLGLERALVTGDHDVAARRAAERVGVADVASEVTPEGKVERVRRAREAGRRVLFVGDGINDAAAMAAADVGIAMGGGAEVAVHAADFVVRAPRLSAVADVVELARVTLRRIRQNLGLALGYNMTAIPLACVGWIDPLWAAVAMGLSSLVVTGNAVRLLRWSPSS